MPPPPPTPQPLAEDGGALEALELMELRSLRLEAELLATRRELLQQLDENLRLRQQAALRRVADRLGLTGEVRIDLVSGRVSGTPRGLGGSAKEEVAHG